eukprot:CAMPEP_0119510040 /NCGR_PEP_ID=MMETSP1344-20130328/29140_1 /TAXON_ID=236787 /ORGANISM="Florenciella parvula, Strain CCMP2471" /LENGTH=84 /DNA_ID=CAMNT_0007546927 /DNA_START=11 /DNA_END=261 /DNA_ORIENTATION=-
MNAVRAETKAKAAADAARPTGPTDRERDLQEELELVQFNLAAAEERNQETLEMRTTLSEVRLRMQAKLTEKTNLALEYKAELNT